MTPHLHKTSTFSVVANQRFAHTTLTPDDVAQFERDGVVCLRGVLDDADIADLRASVDRLSSEVTDSVTGYDVSAIVRNLLATDGSAEASGTQYDLAAVAEMLRAKGVKPLLDELEAGDSQKSKGSFLLDTSTWTRDRAIRELVLDSDLPTIAAGLLRASKVNFYDDQLFVKEPYTDQRTAFHQDYGYFNLDGIKGCVMWVPLDSVDRKRGTIEYVRGSHRWGDVYKPNWFFCQEAFPGSEGADLPDIEGTMDQYDIMSFDVEPGDVIIHHFRTVHGAGGNHSPDYRRALSLRYCGEDMRYFDRPGTAPQPHHRHNLKEGDALDCEQFPVVWPRPYPGFRLSSYYEQIFNEVGSAA